MRRQETTAHKSIAKMLTPADLAEICGVPIASVYGWNSDGTGPRYVRVGRHVRYRIQDVEVWLDRRTNQSWWVAER